MQFITRNTTMIKSSISCKNNEIREVCHLKFLGLEIDNTLSWNLHIHTVVNKLTRVFFMIRSVKPYMSLSSLMKIYYSLFYSMLSYSIIFWGQASNSKRLFLSQKRVLRIMTGQGNRSSCRNLFKQLGILPLKSQYIYSILLFVSKNWNYFITNYDTHNLQTRQSNNLFSPISTLMLYQKVVYYTGIKLVNKLPSEIKETILTQSLFKRTLRSYLVSLCFYEMEEFLTLQINYRSWICMLIILFLLLMLNYEIMD
jgi:hypothetical protein